MAHPHHPSSVKLSEQHPTLIGLRSVRPACRATLDRYPLELVVLLVHCGPLLYLWRCICCIFSAHPQWATGGRRGFGRLHGGTGPLQSISRASFWLCRANASVESKGPREKKKKGSSKTIINLFPYASSVQNIAKAHYNCFLGDTIVS